MAGQTIERVRGPYNGPPGGLHSTSFDTNWNDIFLGKMNDRPLDSTVRPHSLFLRQPTKHMPVTGNQATEREREREQEEERENVVNEFTGLKNPYT